MPPPELSHVFDLPQIWTKPSYERLTSTLALLQVKPPSWSVEKEQAYLEDSKAVAAYLTQIISSNLRWLDESQRETIYEIASKRMSERSGRTGMSAITRGWTIPVTSSCPEITLQIHEPPLTEDNLGLKTWASSYLMAKRLETIGAKHLGSLLQEPQNMRGLELGSGTGLVGIAAASIWRCYMHLTDLPEILPNLTFNTQQNLEIIESRGGKCTTAVHDWKDPPSAFTRYQVILAADPLYSPDHPVMLASNIARFLSNDSKARAIIELPMRDKSTEDMCQQLQNLMIKEDFILLEDGFESGFDDWEKNGERGVVRCWWGVFSRRI